jgi:hypothetical protein
MLAANNVFGIILFIYLFINFGRLHEVHKQAKYKQAETAQEH